MMGANAINNEAVFLVLVTTEATSSHLHEKILAHRRTSEENAVDLGVVSPLGEDSCQVEIVETNENPELLKGEAEEERTAVD